MDKKDSKLRAIWYQEKIPVVFREGKSKPILIRLPYTENNRLWLKAEHRNIPKWIKKYKCWETPKSWFEEVIKKTIENFGNVYVIQPFRSQQKCAPACWNATGIECECSCLGGNHGSGNPQGKWHVVSETYAVSWGQKQYSCRLIVHV